MSEHSNAAAVRAAYEAVGRDDVAAFGAALADDDYAAVLIDVTMALGDRRRTGEYVDVYRLRDGRPGSTTRWRRPPGSSATSVAHPTGISGRAERKEDHGQRDDDAPDL